MIQKTLEETKKLVWPVINGYLKDPPYPKQFSLGGKFPKEISLYWKINREYPERKGKYLRPTLVLLTAKAMGTASQKVIQTAAAMQLSEDWILIHDDVEDNSDLRRDKPTLHKMYGTNLAINTGDALHMIMWKMVNDVNLKAISDEFYQMLLRTALGQGVEEIWTERGSKRISSDEYFFVADSKSAYYSMAGPMRLGAILAKASASKIEAISEFGLHLGRCFQLVDDILDMDQDKKEGKITLANTKGLDYAKKLAEKEKGLAKEIFDTKLKFLKKEPARTQLAELIDFILERKY